MKSSERRMDPELAEVLAGLPQTGDGFSDLSDIEASRQAVRRFAAATAARAPAHPGIAVRESTVAVPDGPDVPVRVVRPVEAGRDLPVLLWFHGGGQIRGSAAQDDPFLSGVCSAIGCAAVAVDYRLAPEARSPAAAQDGLAAYRWLAEHGSDLGLDAGRVGLAGASGGGGIAAAVALMVRDLGLRPPLFQALTYPMLDDRNATASSREVIDIGIWDRATSISAWEAILGEPGGGADVSPYQAPARASHLEGLPPTFLAVGDLDLLRDEGLNYALRLLAAGVPVDLHLYAGAFHAWDLFAPASSLGREFTRTWSDYVRRQLALPAAPPTDPDGGAMPARR